MFHGINREHVMSQRANVSLHTVIYPVKPHDQLLCNHRQEIWGHEGDFDLLGRRKVRVAIVICTLPLLVDPVKRYIFIDSA
jgi:hypothetical protein